MTERPGSHLDVTAILVKTMAVLCVRNTKLEHIHAGIRDIRNLARRCDRPLHTPRIPVDAIMTTRPGAVPFPSETATVPCHTPNIVWHS